MMSLLVFLLVPLQQREEAPQIVDQKLQGLWRTTNIRFLHATADGTVRKSDIDCENRAFVILENALVDIYDTEQLVSCLRSGTLKWDKLAKNEKNYLFWIEKDEDVERRRVAVRILEEDKLELTFLLEFKDAQKTRCVYHLTRAEDPELLEKFKAEGIFPDEQNRWRYEGEKAQQPIRR